jgi:general secretion pathway protein J
MKILCRSLTSMGIAIMQINRHSGFTLLEILVALFVFTILSMMMTGALRSVINTQSGTERSAARIRDLQIALVRMSRDVEQIVNRPVRNANGSEASAFFGTPKGFAFTHGGLAGSGQRHQVLQRTQYSYNQRGLWRLVWDVLDQAPNSPKPSQREVLANVNAAKFEYLDDKHAAHGEWPVSGSSSQPLPRAVRITLTITDWGTIRQTYVIPAQVSNASVTAQLPATPPKP